MEKNLNNVSQLQMNVIESNEKTAPLVISNNTATTGTIGVANGLTNASTLSNTLYPWWYQTYYPYNTVRTAWVSIDKAENGFIVVKGGLTYVCKNVAEVTKF